MLGICDSLKKSKSLLKYKSLVLQPPSCPHLLAFPSFSTLWGHRKSDLRPTKLGFSANTWFILSPGQGSICMAFLLPCSTWDLSSLNSHPSVWKLRVINTGPLGKSQLFGFYRQLKFGRCSEYTKMSFTSSQIV